MTSHLKAIAAALALFFLFGLSPSRAQQSIEEGAGDPSTPLGRSIIQNQEYQQQEQQNERQDRQNQQDLQSQEQQFNQMNQSNQQQSQYYGSGGGEMSSGPFGAIYFDPAHPKSGRTSFNYPTARTAEAAAMGACSHDAGHRCREAIVFQNACAVRAFSRNGLWVARAASSAALAHDMALDACQKAGGRSCDTKEPECSPRNN